ncbi:MAG TPA: HIT family protein [Pseudolabrys sp.]|jgi:diadenosine tetraphosphate (Ap4A) HIT family hydrolase|nr:HIT family protein [Pseudolabrys sp.]
MDSGFTLDPQLKNDTLPVKDLALCSVLLNDDANFPWLILVPRRPGMVELIDLNDADRATLWSEIAQTSRVLKKATGCHKLNVAQLGNQVAQLHIHIIAREKNDAAWPGPVWGKAPRKAYDAAARKTLIDAIRSGL